MGEVVMKRLLALVVCTVFSMLPSLADAVTCLSVDALPPNQKKNSIQIELNKLLPGGGSQEACFQMAVPLVMKNGSDGFILNLNGTQLADDIKISGLFLKNDDVVPLTTPFLSITHNGEGTVTLNNISFGRLDVDPSTKGVVNGVVIEGDRGITLAQSRIAGDSAGTGTCISIKSPGSIIDGVDVSGCADGVQVDADNVIIRNESSIHQNQIGVHILAGRTGTEIDSSLIYFNNDNDNFNLWKDDGIRIDGGVLHEAALYDVVEKDRIPVLDDNQPYDYEGRKPYILLDLPKGQNGTIEFFLSDEKECNLPVGVQSRNQPCALIKSGTPPLPTRIQIDGTQLDNDRLIEVQVPDELKDKRVVTVYTAPEEGTTGISRQFVFECGVVAFVATPYDIPTSGGAIEVPIESGDSTTEEQVQQQGGDEVGGGSDTGGGGISAAAGGCGGGASLTGDQFSTMAFGLDLWLLTLAAAVIATLRTAKVRVKKRK